MQPDNQYQQPKKSNIKIIVPIIALALLSVGLGSYIVFEKTTSNPIESSKEACLDSLIVKDTVVVGKSHFPMIVDKAFFDNDKKLFDGNTIHAEGLSALLEKIAAINARYPEYSPITTFVFALGRPIVEKGGFNDAIDLVENLELGAPGMLLLAIAQGNEKISETRISAYLFSLFGIENSRELLISQGLLLDDSGANYIVPTCQNSLPCLSPYSPVTFPLSIVKTSPTETTLVFAYAPINFEQKPDTWPVDAMYAGITITHKIIVNTTSDALSSARINDIRVEEL